MKTGGFYKYWSDNTTTSATSSIGKKPEYKSKAWETVAGADWFCSRRKILFARGASYNISSSNPCAKTVNNIIDPTAKPDYQLSTTDKYSRKKLIELC